MKYNFYIQKCLKDGTPIAGTLKNLEEDFEGLRYSKCVGLNTYGKVQNIHKETFAEKDGIRTYVPDVLTNADTTITLTLYFFGENRQRTYDAFNKFISKGYNKYFDDARNKSFIFIVDKEIKVKEENWYKGMPYLAVDYSLTNIQGKTTNV
jgi:hypothetical protein